MRLATGEEALIARVVAPDGRMGYGFSFRLDATEARHMAEWGAGVRGYRALVPDLYRGKVALEANEAQHLMTGLNFGDAAGQDIRGAVQYLKQTSPKVGVTGFCMGGALTVLSAVNVPETDAAVIWYGYPPLQYVDAKKIKAPLLGHWATQNQAFAIGGVDALEKKLREANVKFEFHRYNCKHAFANETADQKKLDMLKYDPTAAELAWQRTMDFLGKHIK